MSQIPRRTWDEYFDRGDIVDVAVRSRNILYVEIRPRIDPSSLSMTWDSENPTHFCVIYLDAPIEDNVDGWKVRGMYKPLVGVALLPSPCGLLVSRDIPNAVLAMGRDVAPRDTIDPTGGMVLRKVKTLFGHAYAVGGNRTIFKRLDSANWKQMGDLPASKSIFECGFADMDGFSPGDIYAVGGSGDVWHFDGNSWVQLNFPSNAELKTVTCSPAGQVYVTGEGGSIWVGRDSTWTQIYENRSTVLWNDACWFKDRLWLSSDYQFGFWNGTSVEVPRSADGKEIIMSGHLDVRDGLLAIASATRVLTFDGIDWQVIVARYN